MRWAVLLILLITAGFISAESLWDPDSSGYFTGQRRLMEGDFLRVVLTGEASLSFSSSQVSDKTMTFEFSQPVISVPGGKSNLNTKAQSQSNWKVKNLVIPVKVMALMPHGQVKVEGRRSMNIAGGLETITVTGVVDTRDIQGKDVHWTDVSELSLTYQTADASLRSSLQDSDLTADGKSLNQDKVRKLILQSANRLLDALAN